MSEFPTQKQEDYAKAIAQTLHIDLPKMRTKEAYSRFISNNVNKYKREKQTYLDEQEDSDWFNFWYMGG